MSDWILHSVILGGCFLVLFAIGELLFHKVKVDVELTRKWSHVGTGILILLFPGYVGNIIGVGLLCLSFLGILILSKQFNLLQSINGIERVTYGSALYPVIVFTCYVLADYKNDYLFFYLPLLIMAICDPIAALVGKKLNLKPYKVFSQSKSLGGNIAFFVSAIAVSVLVFNALGIGISFPIIILVAILSTFAEGVSTKGWDNFFIPLSCVLGLLWM